MKLFITFLAFIIALSINAMAQSDALLIKLKSGQTDTITISQIQKIQFENILSVKDEPTGTSNLSVEGNYPNPFSEQTSLEFEIAQTGNVEIIIYDNSGKQIQTLNCVHCQTGKNSLPWNCLDFNNNRVQSGVYYYEVRFGTEVQAKKMILVK
ncbi:MAG: T9SS type A sorting domain-containing protein [bacterium]